jgi:hypothetical protein
VVATSGPAIVPRPSDVPTDVQMEDASPALATSRPAVGQPSGGPLPDMDPAEPAETP